MQLRMRLNFNKIIKQFFYGIFIYSMVLSFFSPIQLYNGTKNYLLDISTNVFVCLTFGLPYSIPCFLIFVYFNQNQIKYSYTINLICGTFIGIISYLIVFTLHNLSFDLKKQYIDNLNFFICSGISGGIFSIVLKKYYS